MTLQLLRRYLKEPWPLLNMGLALVTFAIAPQMAVYLGIPILLLNSLFLPQRASLFEATLPINAREIVLARVMAVTIVTVVPLLVWAVRMAQWLEQRPMEFLSANAYGPLFWTSARIAEVTLAIITLSALPSLVHPKKLSAPSLLPVLRLWGACGVICALVIAFVPSATALLILLLFVTATLHRISTVVPEGFQVMGLEVEGVAVPSKLSRWLHAEPSEVQARWVWPMIRSTLSVQTFISMFIMLIVGLWGSNTVVAILLLSSGFEINRMKLVWMTRLPISSRSRLMLLLAPTVLAVAAYPLGVLIGRSFSLRESLGHDAPYVVESDKVRYESPARIPLEYWTRAKGDSVPDIVAPWGESVRPFTIDLKLITLYNPFSSRTSNSKRFIDWQFERATTAIYGVAIVRERYSDTGPLPRRVDKSSARLVISTSLFLFVALSIALLHEMNRKRLSGGSSFSQIGFALLLTSPVIVVFAVSMKLGFAMGMDDLFGGLGGYYVLHIAQALHANLLIIIPSAVVLLALLFQLLAWKFRMNEVEGIAMTPAMLARAATIKAGLFERGN